MMETITNAVLSFFELAEAEGRSLKDASVAVFSRMLMLFFGGALLFVAAVIGGWAAYMYLEVFIGSLGAAATVACVFALTGIILMAGGRHKPEKVHEPKHAEEKAIVPADGGGKVGK